MYFSALGVNRTMGSLTADIQRWLTSTDASVKETVIRELQSKVSKVRALSEYAWVYVYMYVFRFCIIHIQCSFTLCVCERERKRGREGGREGGKEGGRERERERISMEGEEKKVLFVSLDCIIYF